MRKWNKKMYAIYGLLVGLSRLFSLLGGKNSRYLLTLVPWYHFRFLTIKYESADEMQLGINWNNISRASMADNLHDTCGITWQLWTDPYTRELCISTFSMGIMNIISIASDGTVTLVKKDLSLLTKIPTASVFSVYGTLVYRNYWKLVNAKEREDRMSYEK